MNNLEVCVKRRVLHNEIKTILKKNLSEKYHPWQASYIEHSKCYILSFALYSWETWILKEMVQKYLENIKMWSWRRIEDIKWSDKVTNEEVLQHIEEKRIFVNNILYRNTTWIGNILRRDCLLHDAIEGQIMEVKGVRRRRRRL